VSGAVDQSETYGSSPRKALRLVVAVLADTTVPVPPTIWDGRWHHAAGTFDGFNIRLFVDGKLAGSSAIPTTIDYNLPFRETMLGGYPGTCRLTMTGTLDQVSVWTEAIPVDQIWKKFGWFLRQPLNQ
jgi:hypothetical protein